MHLPDELSHFFNLAVALGIGLLVGAERGWRERAEDDARQSAGIRTFSIAGLLGGVAVLLAQGLGPQLGAAAWAAVLLVVGILALAGYVAHCRITGDVGLTTELALLTTFALGSLAMAGMPLLAAGCAVVLAILLSLKERLHQALQRMEASELTGAFKLLFISLVVLPVLPNEGYGPWQVLNPYTIWWMVVLIAALGFAAYVAIRVAGERYGLMLTAVLGSIVSSTAITLTLSKMGERRELRWVLAAGLLVASGLMFVRMLLAVAVINHGLLPALALPLLACTAVYIAGGLVFWLRASRSSAPQAAAQAPLNNPFELWPALRFAALLTLILLLVQAGRHYLGDAGVYVVALLAGLTDVDAITLSLSRSALGNLDAAVAVRGIFLAAVSNSLVKLGLVGVVGGRALFLPILPVVLGGLALGSACLLWL
ncbi:DUF4010 domain-containing protein [Corticibacter populi]|uniref:DUF4010 domain-containing protein n=1 Tax=Corticibacter populi TaxID=1550736 RepID=A0A3M6QTN4_9BURK|nr:MgtC/SapB family protein [Corticibacter populi]RMX06394.1 DUF4010 domain-containing protein [Corticibacter populi]RZS32060.1 uncharacterized membrane protein (DUF4010 family) [Corticibacter populi]